MYIYSLLSEQSQDNNNNLWLRLDRMDNGMGIHTGARVFPFAFHHIRFVWLRELFSVPEIRKKGIYHWKGEPKIQREGRRG